MRGGLTRRSKRLPLTLTLSALKSGERESNRGNVMKVLIIGGAGMVGRKLAERLAKDSALAGKPSQLTLGVAPAAGARGVAPVASSQRSAPAAGRPTSCSPTSPTLIFHLAAIVSGEADGTSTGLPHQHGRHAHSAGSRAHGHHKPPGSYSALHCRVQRAVPGRRR